MSCADTEIGRSGRSQSEPRNKRLIAADTVYGLLQSANDLMRERFTSKGRTLDDNSWRTCDAHDLVTGFWKAVRDHDFGSVLTYAVMLAGRDVNVTNTIRNCLESYDWQLMQKDRNHAEYVKKLKDEHCVAIEEAGRKMETMQDTIRLQHITIEQHEKTIADLRSKLDGKEEPGPYRHLACGVALESERIPELCYSVETVRGELVETLVIQGDPAAVKDLVQTVRAEQTTRTGPSGVNVTLDSLKAKEDPVIAGTVAAAVAKIYGDKRKPLCFLSPTEEQSGVNRLQLATNLIMQLDIGHDGRATWLQSYAHHPDEAVSRAISNDPRRWNSIDEVVAFVNRTRAVEAHVAKNSAL